MVENMQLIGKVEDKTGIQIGALLLVLAMCIFGCEAELIFAAGFALLAVGFIGFSFEKKSGMYYLGTLAIGILLSCVVAFFGCFFLFLLWEGMTKLGVLLGL